VEQVLGEAFGVVEELRKIVLAGVVELLSGGAAKHFVDQGGVLAFQLPVLFENFFLGGLENAIQAAQDGHGKHDFAVFGRAVRAAEEVGHVPDEADEAIAVIGHWLRVPLYWAPIERIIRISENTRAVDTPNNGSLSRVTACSRLLTLLIPRAPIRMKQHFAPYRSQFLSLPAQFQ